MPFVGPRTIPEQVINNTAIQAVFNNEKELFGPNWPKEEVYEEDQALLLREFPVLELLDIPKRLEYIGPNAKDCVAVVWTPLFITMHGDKEAIGKGFLFIKNHFGAMQIIEITLDGDPEVFYESYNREMIGIVVNGLPAQFQVPEDSESLTQSIGDDFTTIKGHNKLRPTLRVLENDPSSLDEIEKIACGN